MGRTGHGNEQEREHCIDSLPLSEKGVTWPCVGCQLRQWSFKELPHEHQHQHQQPDELLPPVALDWATALLVCRHGDTGGGS